MNEAAAQVFTLNDKSAFYQACFRESRRCEINEELFYEFLDLLPPKVMYREMRLTDGSIQRVTFGFCEGEDIIVGFWKAPGGRFFACPTTEVARG